MNAGRGSMSRFLSRARLIIPLVAGLMLAQAPGAGAQAGAPPAGQRPITLVVMGDSLSAGLGLPAAEAFPMQLQKALSAKGATVKVVNAGVSGDTTSDGLARIDWSVGPDADAVILELGANDALRGISPALTQAALDQMLARLGERHLPVLLAGMRAPPNMGEAYGAAFDRIFPDLAAKHGVPLYPFFLDGVAADLVLVQADGMHPNAAGVGVIVQRILPSVGALLAMVKR